MQPENSYAKHVRRLYWTVIDTSGQFWGARVDESDGDNNDLPLYVPEDGTQS
jgi:hypothetical protein